jgi:multidrug efflux pump subunit AcrB
LNITRLAIDNNRLTTVLLAVVLVAGIQTFFSMPRAYDPGFIVRAAQVITYFPGASPERVEQLVSSQLEDIVKEIPELDYVKSESRTGVSIITVNISQSFTDMRPIWDRLRRKVEDLADDLPEGVVGPYVNDEFGDVFGIVINITGEGFSYSELKQVAEEVRDELLRLPDAAKVEIHGLQDERIFIEYDNARLSELGISPYQLSAWLSSRNIVISGGAFDLGDERIALEPSGNFESLEDIGKTIIETPGSDHLLYLKDIAHISRGYVDPPTALVHASGVPGVAIAISMREGGNNIRLGEAVRSALVEFNQTYPYGIEFDPVNFSPAEVSRKVKDFVTNLLQAIAVVTLVMLLTLGLRTGLIVSTLIPLSMLLSLIGMSLFDIGLDQVSLASLIIALGMLVDNGIVMAESIMVQMGGGKRPVQAAIDSASELKLPLLTASMTTAAAFLPIYLAESDVGEFTASLFKVVSITLLCSWLVALTVIPLLCVLFLKVEAQQQRFDTPLMRSYRQLLLFILRHKAVILSLTLLVFLLVMGGLNLLPKVFFPPSDRSFFKVELDLPTGTSIDKTRRVVSDIERFMHDELVVNEQRRSGITNWISYIGNAGPRFILTHNPKPSDPGYALMVVNVNDLGHMDDLMNSLKRYALDQHHDLELSARRFEDGPAIENPVEVRLLGSDSDLLFTESAALKQRMRQISGLENIKDDWGQRLKKLVIRVDQPRALRAGITSQDIAVSLQAGLSGMTLTEYREGEEIIPIVLRSESSNRNDINKVESLSVYVQLTGKSVPLKQVADVELVWDLAKVMRRDGVRTVTVGAKPAAGFTATDRFAQLLPWLQAKQAEWGHRLRYQLGGEKETSGRANQSIMDKLPLAGFIILLLLVAQFNSIRKTLIILTTIPLGMIGVVLGLLLADSYFGFMTLLGIVSLAGIVINNAIVLLERIKIELDGGMAHAQAIIAAAQQRARPILLTTATTVLGLVPLYLGGGEMWRPMAVSIMAGLLFSTLLTLGVVPVLYATLFKVEY